MSKKVSGWPLIAPTEVDTSITGDQVLEALAADVEASDSGKVLTATYGGLEGEETGSVMWASALPVIGEGDAGKVLTVNAGETGTEWAAPAGGGSKVTVTHQPTSGGSPVNTFVWSHTVSQIADMLNNGITPILEYNMLDDNGDPAPITPIYIPYTGCRTTFDAVNSISFVSDVFIEVDPDTDGWIMKKTAILYTAEGTEWQEEQFVLMPD